MTNKLFNPDGSIKDPETMAVELEAILMLHDADKVRKDLLLAYFADFKLEVENELAEQESAWQEANRTGDLKSWVCSVCKRTFTGHKVRKVCRQCQLK